MKEKTNGLIAIIHLRSFRGSLENANNSRNQHYRKHTTTRTFSKKKRRKEKGKGDSNSESLS